MSSKCKLCGEQITKTGNYTFRILPAKRIPKKARKLIKESSDGKQSVQDLKLSSWGTTSFQKFLMKRAQPANFIEMTCGKCGAMSKIKMLKNKFVPKEEGRPGEISKGSCNYQNTTVSTSTKSKKRKVKGGRDKNAGLTLTWPGNPNTSKPQVTPAPSVNFRSRNETVSAFKKQKEMENLKKILFESKKAKKSGSSLEDFLSAI
ncbi:unnamed protein product [Orchesella dallaii]|uniref:Uncharacterized protein n=1 Tax=Orchesella dallaii TaxID=48710 RepID=A0ABP1RTL2_9HEXA